MNTEEKREKERLKYLMGRLIRFYFYKKDEEKNPSPDHEGKMRVIRIELNRLNDEVLFSKGKIPQKEYLKRRKKWFDIK